MSTVVMKNWEPLVLGPALAMDRTPGACRILNDSSAKRLCVLGKHKGKGSTLCAWSGGVCTRIGEWKGLGLACTGCRRGANVRGGGGGGQSFTADCGG